VDDRVAFWKNVAHAQHLLLVEIFRGIRLVSWYVQPLNRDALMALTPKSFFAI